MTDDIQAFKKLLSDIPFRPSERETKLSQTLSVKTATAREGDAYFTALKSVFLFMASATDQYKKGNLSAVPHVALSVIHKTIHELPISPQESSTFNAVISSYFMDKFASRMVSNDHVPNHQIELPTLLQFIMVEAQRFVPYDGDYGAPTFISREQEIQMMPWHNVYKAHFALLPPLDEDE